MAYVSTEKKNLAAPIPETLEPGQILFRVTPKLQQITKNSSVQP
jgi:hypothetical protein